MTKGRVVQLTSFVDNELNTQEEIDLVLYALLLKTCKNGYSEETHCRECHWNWGGLCRLVGKYVKMCQTYGGDD